MVLSYGSTYGKVELAKGANNVFTVLGVLLLGGIVFGVATRIFADEEGRGYAVTLAVIPGLVFGLIGGFVTAGVIGAGLPQQPQVLKRHQLVSLHDATGIEGAFVLASGRVDSTTRIYYVESTAKGYQFHSMNEEDSHVYILQENRTDGELDVVTTRFQRASDENWAIAFGEVDYVFHIPMGSITTCFELNQGGNTGCPAS